MTHRAQRLPGLFGALYLVLTEPDEPDFEPLCNDDVGVNSDDDTASEEGETLWYWNGNAEAENAEAENAETENAEAENPEADGADESVTLVSDDNSDESVTLGSEDTWSDPEDWDEDSLDDSSDDSDSDSDIESENVVNFSELSFAMSFI